MSPEASTLSVVKYYPGGRGHRHRLALLSDIEAKSVLDGLAACGLGALPGRGPRRGADLHTLRWEGLGKGVASVDDPHAAKDGRFSACVAVLEDAVNLHIGSLPWRDVFYPKQELGFLRAESTPAARVFVNGEDTGEVTPVPALALRVGVHQVTFVSEGLRRTYEVRVLPEATTNLDVDLR